MSTVVLVEVPLPKNKPYELNAVFTDHEYKEFRKRIKYRHRQSKSHCFRSFFIIILLIVAIALIVRGSGWFLFWVGLGFLFLFLLFCIATPIMISYSYSRDMRRILDEEIYTNRGVRIRYVGYNRQRRSFLEFTIPPEMVYVVQTPQVAVPPPQVIHQQHQVYVPNNTNPDTVVTMSDPYYPQPYYPPNYYPQQPQPHQQPPLQPPSKNDMLKKESDN